MEEEIISIKIGGLECKLQCPVEEQPHLLEAAEKLDKKQSISSLSLSSFIFCETLKAYRERDIESRLASESNP